jgi:ABC-type nickel/cobalt efflux system permease component RcnA
MSQQTQLRVTGSLNLAASCAGAIFFVLNLYRLITVHQASNRRWLLVAFLVLYAFGAYFFWGRYRAISAQMARFERPRK